MNLNLYKNKSGASRCNQVLRGLEQPETNIEAAFPQSQSVKNVVIPYTYGMKNRCVREMEENSHGGAVVQGVLMIVSKENQKKGGGLLSATNYYTTKQFEQWGLWVWSHHHTQCPKHLQWQNRYCRKSWTAEVTQSGRRLQFLVHDGWRFGGFQLSTAAASVSAGMEFSASPYVWASSSTGLLGLLLKRNVGQSAR